jgi:thioredoxin-related protein
MHTKIFCTIYCLLLACLVLVVQVKTATADSWGNSGLTHSKKYLPSTPNRNLLPTSKPMLLIFENTVCSECDDFRNEVLSHQPVSDLLKQFEVVKLDAMDNRTVIITPDGKCTTSATLFKWYTFNRMPAIVIFDIDGRTILKTDVHLSPQHMLNALHVVLEKAYEKGWPAQKFAESQSIKKQ